MLTHTRNGCSNPGVPEPIVQSARVLLRQYIVRITSQGLSTQGTMVLPWRQFPQGPAGTGLSNPGVPEPDRANARVPDLSGISHELSYGHARDRAQAGDLASTRPPQRYQRFVSEGPSGNSWPNG